MMSKIANMVREFHETYKCAMADSPNVDDINLRALRWSLIDEEAKELNEALGLGDIVEIADALGDLAYVIYGAALSFGIDLDAIVTEVHRSNMSKLAEDGTPIFREDGKVLKGPNYFKPDIAKILGL